MSTESLVSLGPERIPEIKSGHEGPSLALSRRCHRHSAFEFEPRVKVLGMPAPISNEVHQALAPWQQSGSVQLCYHHPQDYEDP